MQLDYQQQNTWQVIGGQKQSPINLITSQARAAAPQAQLTFNYQPHAIKAHNSGNGLEVFFAGTANLNQREFNTTQFHIHTPSEHQLDGKSFAGEIHFVHQANNGALAVVAAFLSLGEAAPFLQSVIDNWQAPADFELPLNQVLKDNPSYYHYLGSLTTPPLTETVEWYVLTEPISISAEQLAFLSDLKDHNNRGLQPLNDRPILYHE